MRHTILLAALTGLSLAVPKPQDIDIDGVEAADDPVVVAPAVDVVSESVSVAPQATQAALAAEGVATAPPQLENDKRSLGARATCAKQPAGSAPTTTPDTPDAFVANPTYLELAENAPTPDGYAQVFSGLSAAVAASNYMSLSTLTSYDTLTCASYCDRKDGCNAFNIFIERDPSVNPDSDKCASPPSTSNFRCTLWGAPIASGQATNTTATRNQFQVVFAGSNGYVKNTPPPAVPGFQGPQRLGGAINAPLDSRGYNTYMGYKFYPFSQAQSYDPLTCASACNATTAYDAKHPDSAGNWMACNYFVAYTLSKNGVPQGLYCSMYNTTWAPSYGNNYGMVQGANRYSVSQAHGYSLQGYLDSLNVVITTTQVSTVTLAPTITVYNSTAWVTSTTTITSASVTISSANKPGVVRRGESTAAALPTGTFGCPPGKITVNGSCIEKNPTLVGGSIAKRQYTAGVTSTVVIQTTVVASLPPVTSTISSAVTSTKVITVSTAIPTLAVCDAQYFANWGGFYPSGIIGQNSDDKSMTYLDGIPVSDMTLQGKLECCSMCFSRKDCLLFWLYQSKCQMMVRTKYAGAGDKTDVCPNGVADTVRPFNRGLGGDETGPCNPPS